MGDGQDGRDGDPFEQLLDPGFVSAAAHREPSAEERRRAAEREARAADLRRRLAAEDAQCAVEERSSRRSESRARRSTTAKKAEALVLLVAVIGGAVWFESRGGGAGVASPSSEAARPENYPPVDESASATPLGAPLPAPPAPGGFEFIADQKVGSGPVGWDPCRPIRYVVNPAGEPAGGGALIQEAVARTTAPTGLTFVDDGTTTEEWSKDREPYQPDRYGQKWAPVLISWTTEAQSAEVAGYIAGVGGPIISGGPNGRIASLSGVVLLDAEDIGRILTMPGGQAKERAVIQHVLGHLVGLAHTSDKSQLMYSESTDEQTGDWGTGDLAGLHQLGTGDRSPDL